VADRIPAGLTERGKVLFRAHQDPTGSRSRRGTVLVDIRLAGFAHGGGPHQRRLALLMEILEMRLNTFGESIALRLCGLAEFRRVARASRYDRNVLREGRGD
jgi:hypothetical protein